MTTRKTEVNCLGMKQLLVKLGELNRQFRKRMSEHEAAVNDSTLVNPDVVMKRAMITAAVYIKLQVRTLLILRRQILANYFGIEDKRGRKFAKLQKQLIAENDRINELLLMRENQLHFWDGVREREGIKYLPSDLSAALHIMNELSHLLDEEDRKAIEEMPKLFKVHLISMFPELNPREKGGIRNEEAIDRLG